MIRQLTLRTGGLAGLLLAALLALAAPAFAQGHTPTGYIFVSNEKTNNIIVLDPKDYSVVKDIKTSRRPRDMHFTKDKSLLYVACGDDDVIDVIDVATLEVTDHIPTGRSPEMFVLSGDEKLIYVSNEENSTVQVIDIADKIIVHEVPTGAEPEGVMLNEDGTVLYATSEVADMVHVIDTESGVVTDNIIVGTRPRRFAMPAGTNELWVTDELSGEVSIIDRDTKEVTQTLEFLPPGFRKVDVTPVGITVLDDGSKVFVTLGRANHVAVVNTATKEIEGYVLVGSRAWGVDLSRDQKTLYVSNGLSDDISIVDIASLKNVRSIPVGRVPHSILVDD